MRVTATAYASGLVLALVFLWSAMAKLRDRFSVVEAFALMRIRSPGSVVVAVVVIELAAAAALTVVPRAGSALAFTLLVSFSIVLANTVRSGLEVSCLCFGSGSGDIVGWPDLMRNGLLAGAAGFTFVAAEPVVPSAGVLLVTAVMWAPGVTAVRLARRASRQGSPARGGPDITR